MAKVGILYRPINQLVCQIYMSVEFDTGRCVCRLNLVDGRTSVYRLLSSHQQSLSSTLVGVLSLVGVSAEFGSHRLVRVVW